ncbi:MAG: sulfotransferase [Pseudomonadota bacterium]
MTGAVASAPRNGVGKTTLARAQSLLKAGALEEARRLAVELTSRNADDAEALYVRAVCERFADDIDAALATLAHLRDVRPGYGRAWQETGHCLRTRNDAAGALAAFREAVARNDSLIASWMAIVELAETLFKHRLAAEARERHARLAALPPELLSVRNMTAEGRLLKAEQLCRAYLKQHPQHVEGMRLLADLGVRSGVLDDAEFLLESAVAFEPDNVLARHDYMNVLYRRQKYAEALEQARLLREAAPGNEAFEIAYANQSVAVGNYDEALEIYDAALAAHPEHAMLHLLRGHALKTTGCTDEAIGAYRGAYAARPEFGDAYWSLANLKTYRFESKEIAAMRRHETDAGTPLTDRIHLNFALGKALEDVQDFEAAFAHYERGNRQQRNVLEYDAARMTERLALQREHGTAELFARRAGSGCAASDPIFIVGLPRAGSTLLEQILASHSQVDGTFELPNIAALAHRLDGRRRTDAAPRYPARLHELTAEQLTRFGEAFIDDTRVHRQGSPRFTDKMPNNFRHIALIRLILPNAKIINARRHPMACCFSGFKQLFASGQEFTYGLHEIGRYYRDYVALMDHWDLVLPGAVLRVQYEDLVEDTETQVRRLLEFCGLQFEQNCVEFYRSKRSVRTPSAEQVRQPIYKSGLAQWRHFEPWLDPLKAALGDNVLARYPLDDHGRTTGYR